MFIFYIVDILASIYIAVIVLEVALSWLIAFGIVNAENEAARNLGDVLKKLTDPVYKPLRKYVPPIGNIDITPLVVIVALQILIAVI